MDSVQSKVHHFYSSTQHKPLQLFFHRDISRNYDITLHFYNNLSTPLNGQPSHSDRVGSPLYRLLLSIFKLRPFLPA